MNALAFGNPEYSVYNNVGIVILTNQFPDCIGVGVLVAGLAGYGSEKADVDPE